jgi:hypothetical protein
VSSYDGTNDFRSGSCDDSLMYARRAVALVLCGALFGCSAQDLAFRTDERLQILNLTDRSTIEIPFALQFSFAGELSADGVSAFGILIDWTPPPPGKSLASLLDRDPACRGEAGCPGGYLERNRIIVTTSTSYLMDNVGIGTNKRERRSFHEVTVVLVDSQGRRISEASAFSRFRTAGVNP